MPAIISSAALGAGMDKPPLAKKIPALIASVALWPTAVSAQSVGNFSGSDLLVVGPVGTGQEAVVGLFRFVFGLIFVFFFVQLIFGVFLAQTHGDNEDAKESMMETFKSAMGGMAVSLVLIVLAGSLVGAAFAAAARLNSPAF